MSRVEFAQHWLSKTVEGTYNTAEPTGSNYEYVATRDPYFYLPKLEKLNDGDRLGVAAPTHLCNTYWSHCEFGVKDDLETSLPARLFRRALGGAVTDTVVTAAASWDHTFACLDRRIGDILPSFGWATKLGAADWLLHGVMVDRFKIFQAANAERVQYEADLVGSGKFTNPHGLTGLPALAALPCMDGFRTKIEYQDGGTVDLSSLGKVVEWSIEHNNNIRRNRRRTGDTIQTVSTGSGAHVRKQPAAKYGTVISITLDFNDLTYWTKNVVNAQLTNLKFTVVGPIITGTDRHEVEVIVPSFGFEMVDPTDDDGDAAQQINIVAFEDPVSKGTITGRVRNATATLV
jgi:hypothetical protein